MKNQRIILCFVSLVSFTFITSLLPYYKARIITSYWTFFTQRRYVFTVLAFFGYFNIYSLRVNMSIAVVAMTQEIHVLTENGTEVKIEPEFQWDNKLLGYLLSSFFYGYITTQLLGGYVATRIGGKIIFGTGIAITSIITIISPWLAEVNIYCLLVARIVTGVFEGVTYSSLYSMWAKWIPPLERSRIISIAASGVFAGTVFAMTFYAYIASVAGWRSIFWISGGLGLIWYIFWMLIQSESPEEDERISKEELKYIQESLESEKSIKKPVVPWRSILCSKAVWALNVVLSCEAWGFYTMLTMLPKYFKDVFQYDLSKSGILSALPYLAMAIVIQLSGQIADNILIRKKMSITTVRKSFIVIGFLTQTVFLMGAAFWSDPIGTVFCLVIAVAFGAFALSVVAVNCLDIAPRYAGILFGINNTFGTISGILSPTVAGYIVSTQNPTTQQWQVVFYITAGLYLFGAIFFTIFGSGNIQPWSTPDDKKENNIDTEQSNNKNQ